MVGNDYPDFVQPGTSITGRPVIENEVWAVGGDFNLPGVTGFTHTYEIPNDGMLYALDQVQLSWDIKGLVKSLFEINNDFVAFPLLWDTVINKYGELELNYVPSILANYILKYPAAVRSRLWNSNDKDRHVTILYTFMKFL